MTDEEILQKTRELETEARKLKYEVTRITQEATKLQNRINENEKTRKMFCKVPYMVATIGELLEPEEEEEQHLRCL